MPSVRIRMRRPALLLSIIILAVICLCYYPQVYSFSWQLPRAKKSVRFLKNHHRFLPNNPQQLAIVRSSIPPPASSTSPLFAESTTMSNQQNDEPWTKPRVHNTGIFRSLAILGAIAAAGMSSKSPLSTMLSSQALSCLHLLSFSTWFGTMAYTTFILGITMFKNLPRKTFGSLQSKLFPKYFALSSITIVLQLVTLKGMTAATLNPAKSTKALLVALATTLLNQFVLEPLATDNMFRRYELDDTPNGQDTEEYKQLKKNFGKFHGMSSLVNLIAMCAAVAHGFYLSAAFV